MNAVNALVRDQQEAHLDTAVAAANKWVDLARPIIIASFKLDDLESEIVRGTSFDSRDHRYRTLAEAARSVCKARRELDAMLESVRDDFISDNTRAWERGLSEAESDAVDAFNDALSEETIGLADAVKMVEREWNEAFAKGKPL